ncbi:putative Elongator complex protein 2 [Cercophora samala]|uniref:Elongator complex protein 2 n=1 Tax=Cercophora samala TaxID=330535 RepID=A0AA39Z5H2_9PEZI|nr:putative Elongator complex protein 2 [Cercophora samala]
MADTETIRVESSYLAAGANRYSAASDWSAEGVVAFGSDANVCLWNPQNPRGISSILSQHTGHVKAVKFLPRLEGDDRTILITGGDDKVVRAWSVNPQDATASYLQAVEGHTEPINCIASLQVTPAGAPTKRIFVTGAADATVKIWAHDSAAPEEPFKLLQSIKTTKRFIPLALALSPLDDEANGVVLAVVGTTNVVQIFTAGASDLEFTLQATLPGHENWVRSLDFIKEKTETGSDLLLASASQDKYIRLWRIHQGTALSALNNATGLDLSVSLTPGNKIHKISAGGTKYCIMFEALLLGHEDWIYTARWSRTADGKLLLLSASADNSLSIWESDPESGIWITGARLGEVSREKGATTATGSIGGFWTGLWSPAGTTVITLGRTGSWRRWDYNPSDDAWQQHHAISGHTRAVTGLSWSQDGTYLLSTSSDQTTRLHAQWTGQGTDPVSLGSWHEMSRPQIHGYDLNCIATLGPTPSFVSGADEKLMRVFTEPRAVAKMLSCLTNSKVDISSAPDAANMPVLGLSNKAIDTTTSDPTQEQPQNQHEEEEGGLSQSNLTISAALEATTTHPPYEENLSRHTLWPEVEKLYGHGYEISALCSSHDGKIIASACKASSVNHAVIRLFETERWTELRPPLQAHTLTVARVRFSGDDEFLLSVGRDRQWVVWGRTSAPEKEGWGGYELVQQMQKGHSRMILDCAWAPVTDKRRRRVFATAGRDKLVKFWVGGRVEKKEFGLAGEIKEEGPVTAVDFLPELTQDGKMVLAVGTEAGKVMVVTLGVTEEEEEEEEGGSKVEVVKKAVLDRGLWLPGTVVQLAWRPKTAEQQRDEKKRELAVAGEDGSLRIYEVEV